MTVRDLGDSPPVDSEFLQRLSLNRIDEDIFTGWCHAGAPLRAFGGQVAAQALVAAGTTVDEPDRDVHSLHAYFLRAGSTEDHIVYMVDRLRDGRSFSTRRVKAVQYGKTIFAMSANYADPQQGPAHTKPAVPDPHWIDEVPRPETLKRLDLVEWMRRNGNLTANGYPEHGFVDIRFVTDAAAQRISRGIFDRMAWVRAGQVLPETALYHVCALTYFSDLSMVSTVLNHHGDPDLRTRLDVASLDHAMWFHRRFRADEWLLFATSSPISGEGRGFATGEFYLPDGSLVANAVQEVLVREPNR